MPVVDERKAAPRSALRYRPINQDRAPERTLTRGRSSQPDARLTMARVTADDLDPEESTRRTPSRRSKPSGARQDQPIARTQRRPRPLFFVVLGLLLAVLLWIGLNWLLAWASDVLDLLRYGNPRTYQLDAVVGQGDSAAHPSHFLALNLHGQTVIIEFPAGNPARAREFTLPDMPGPNEDQVVVTLRFLDVNRNGRPDMIITAGGMQTFLVNDAGTFRPPTPGEQQQILAFLQHTH